MNRRSFFKTVTGFVAGACLPKAKADVIMFPTEEKAREFSQKRIEPEYSCSICMSVNPSAAPTAEREEEIAPWDNLGCKDCFRGCGQWDICMATLRKRVEENEAKKEAKRHVEATVEYNKQFWRFYINDKEVDRKRAVDELGVLHFPFRGVKK